MKVLFYTFLLSFSFYFIGVITLFFTTRNLKDVLFFDLRVIAVSFSILWILYFIMISTILYLTDANSSDLLINAIIFLLLAVMMSYDTIIMPIVYLSGNPKDVNRHPDYERWSNDINQNNYKVYLAKKDIINAFATGVLPFSRSIILGKPLVDQLTEEEVKGILAHEVAHLKNHDIIKQLLISISIFFVCYASSIPLYPILYSWPLSHLWVAVHWILFYGLPNLYIMGWYQRFTEYRADSFAARMVGKDSIINALKKMNEITEGGLEKKTLTHPVLSKRIQSILKS